MYNNPWSEPKPHPNQVRVHISSEYLGHISKAECIWHFCIGVLQSCPLTEEYVSTLLLYALCAHIIHCQIHSFRYSYNTPVLSIDWSLHLFSNCTVILSNILMMKLNSPGSSSINSQMAGTNGCQCQVCLKQLCPCLEIIIPLYVRVTLAMKKFTQTDELKGI